MNKTLLIIVLTLVVGGMGGAAGYFLAQTGKPDTSAPLAAAPAKKLLYYRNPMGLPDTSPVPKKDSMGMDYIAVYEGEGETESESGLKISVEKIQKLGVKTEAARLQELDQSVRASGRVEVDERRMATVSAKFEGYIERLWVNTSGQPVGRGQPLFEVYSPELVSAQREYALAAQGVATLDKAGAEAQGAMRQLADAALQRLKNWDISPEQIKALSASGQAKRTLTFRSPVAGVVSEKKAVQGMRFMPGEALFQIADLSTVWIQADIFEQDIAAVHVGQKASVRINAYPGETFTGRIAYVYPSLKAETRTVPVRIELNNPQGRLKPAMFAEVDIPVAGKTPMLTVPTSAVIDSGTRQVVIVELAEGRFAPREVSLGQRGKDYVQIRQGLKDGEKVVVTANFLIDAESNLKAALAGLSKTDSNSTAKSAGHHAEGTLNSIDRSNGNNFGSISVSHGAVPSLNWPPMKMDFVLANPALVDGFKPGAAIAFEFVERKPGEWVVTSIKPAREQQH